LPLCWTAPDLFHFAPVTIKSLTTSIILTIAAFFALLLLWSLPDLFKMADPRHARDPARDPEEDKRQTLIAQLKANLKAEQKARPQEIAKFEIKRYADFATNWCQFRC